MPVPNQAHLYDHPPGHSEVTVKPGVPDATSVSLHSNLHHAHLPPLRATLHLGKSRVSLPVPQGSRKRVTGGDWAEHVQCLMADPDSAGCCEVLCETGDTEVRSRVVEQGCRGAARAALGGGCGRCSDPAMVLCGTGAVRADFACGMREEGTSEGPGPGRRPPAGRPYPKAGAVGVGAQQAEPISGLELAADGEGDESGVVPGDKVLAAEGQR